MYQLTGKKKKSPTIVVPDRSMALIPAGVVTLHKVLEVADSKRANMAAGFTTEDCKRGKYWHLSPGHEVLLNSGSPEKGFALEPHKENTSLRGTGRSP